MAKSPPPRRPPPQKRKSDLPADDAVASRAVVPKKRDPRQAGIFDAPQPAFIRPQLAKLVTEAPEGERWAHELKSDGHRMHARIDRGLVQLITARSGLDWTSRYRGRARLSRGQVWAVRPEQLFSSTQAATRGAGMRTSLNKSAFGTSLLSDRPQDQRPARWPEHVEKGQL
jgi:hypothetical protein